MNKNPAMKKSGLKGSFPSGGSGSLQTGLSSRASLPSSTAETDRRGPNQVPAAACTVKWKGAKR